MSTESTTRSSDVSDWRVVRGEKWRAGLPTMEVMLEPVDEPLVRALDLDVPVRIADVGCGGGGTALSILRQAPAGSVVHGFDISPALVEAARARRAEGERAIAFHVADMASAPAPAQPYDRLVSRFGVMFFDDPPSAFTNLARWLAPGGRFAFAVWGPLAENAWLTSVREVVASVVEIPPADPDGPGPFRYADATKLLDLLAGAGLGELGARPWRGRLPVGGLPAFEAATFALAFFSNFAELLANAGDDAVRVARESLAERFLHHEQSGAVWLDACVHIVTGTRG